MENLELWTKSQPSGQRVDDKVRWAVELLRKYSPHLLPPQSNLSRNGMRPTRNGRKK